MKRNNVNLIKKEDVIEFYKTHTLKETAKHFQIGQARVREWCKELGFEKPVSYWGGQNEEVRRKAKESRERNLLEKYGVSNVFQLQSVKEKIIETNQERYGVSSFLQTEQARDRLRETFKEHGDEIDKKKKETTLSHYGVEHFSQTEEGKRHLIEGTMKRREKLDQMLLSRGVKNSFQLPEVIQKISEKRNAQTFEEKQQVIKKREQTNIEKYGIPYPCSETFTSKGELEVLDFIKSLGFNAAKHYLGKMQLDIYIPEKKFAIEYNGMYWHSIDKKPDKLYHYKKSEACEKQGIRLFHIFEWEWQNRTKQEIIKSILKIALGKVENRIYARECIVKPVNTRDYRDFCNINHLQGYRQASVVYGLYYDDRLVQLMSFNKPQKRNSKINYQWEIVRGCPGSNNLVIGGVSKLWAYFLREQQPESVMSYCDMNKFDGKSYEAIGMCLTKIEKGNRWFIDKETQKVSSWLFRDTKKREQQLQNCFEVYGVGNKTFAWIKS